MTMADGSVIQKKMPILTPHLDLYSYYPICNWLEFWSKHVHRCVNIYYDQEICFSVEGGIIVELLNVSLRHVLSLCPLLVNG